jgi:serine O-acetyltransferase
MLDTLRGDIRAVFARDPAARSLPEVLFCYPGLHTIWIHTVTATDAASSDRVGHAPGE